MTNDARRTQRTNDEPNPEPIAAGGANAFPPGLAAAEIDAAAAVAMFGDHGEPDPASLVATLVRLGGFFRFGGRLYRIGTPPPVDGEAEGGEVAAGPFGG